MILLYYLAVCVVIIHRGLPQLHMTSFPNSDTFNTLLSTDSFNTIVSAKLYGPDSRNGYMALTSAESFPAFVSLGMCALH